LKKRIFYLFEYKIRLFFLKEIVYRNILDDKIEVFICCLDDKIRIEAQLLFGNSVVYLDGFMEDYIQIYNPDLVVCQYIWSFGLKFLKKARENNIPILMYDHGSLINKSYYIIQNNPIKQSYRSDVTLCSHIACWGDHGRECWETYGVLKEKMTVTGCVHLDYMYKNENKLDSTFFSKKLKLKKNTKIILFFANIYHPTISPKWKKRNVFVLKSLEKFVNKNTGYKLLVKPHPMSIKRKKGSFPHDEKTIIVGDLIEDSWEKTVKLDMMSLVSNSDIVIASASSAVLYPLILKRPFVHIEFDENYSKKFSEFGKNYFYNLSLGKHIGVVIKKIINNHISVINKDYSGLVEKLNYKNDGKASDRFIELINAIFIQQISNKEFYTSEVNEFLASLKRFPDLPYAYQNLLQYYSKIGDIKNTYLILHKYIKKFKEKVNENLNYISLFNFSKWDKVNIIRVYEILYRAGMLMVNNIIVLAGLYRELSLYSKSEELLILIKKKHENTEYKKNLEYEEGLLNQKKKFFNQALKNYSIAISFKNKRELNYRILYRMGEVNALLKNYSEAELNLDRCLKLQPTHNAARLLRNNILGELIKTNNILFSKEIDLSKIKLIIWDLDNTLWDGVLAEKQKIALSKDTLRIIAKLDDFGILNSICSKNRFEDCKKVLSKHKIWKFFVFPKISFQGKGMMIKEIIKNMNLRNENVLFIDDQKSNLEEVKFYNKGIATKFPDIITKIKHFIDKNEASLSGKSRIKKYKLLEKKLRFKENISDNDKFLEYAKIHVKVLTNYNPLVDRIIELINRTNQLNYTKRRASNSEIFELLNNKKIKKGCIKVTDRFGDYGVTGFYALKDDKLVHFLFSCRLLNMGIEQWLYQKLNFPKLKVNHPVAIPLKKDNIVTYIKEGIYKSDKKNGSQKQYKYKSCFYKGGCDLLQIEPYLISKGVRFFGEVNYMSKTGMPVHTEHTEMLKLNDKITIFEKEYLSRLIPFLDKKAFQSEIFSNNYDVVVYSPLMDFTQDIYVNKKNTLLRIPFGGINSSIFSEKRKTQLIQKFQKNGITDQFFEKFKKEWKFEGALTASQFEKNIYWLLSKLKNTNQIVFFTASELDYTHPIEGNLSKRYKRLNNVLKNINDNKVIVIDVNEFISSQEDIEDNIRHYKKYIYKNIADRLLEIIKVNS